MNTDQITFTRFVAALSVVFFHYSPQHYGALDDLIKAGPTAVSYFFVLSGFILSIAYYSSINADSASSPNSNQARFNSKTFYIARIARIYPLYLLALLPVVLANYSKIELPSLGFTTFLLQSWFPGHCPASNPSFWPECPLAYNSPGWSLSVEAFFYTAFPLLLAITHKKGLKLLAIIGLTLWITTQLTHTYLLNSELYAPKNIIHDFIYYNPIMHISSFVLGMIVGIYYKNHSTLSNKLAKANDLYLIIFATIIASAILLKPNIANLIGFKIDYTNGLLAPIFLFFIVLLASNRGIIASIFRIRFLILLGEASFAVYILQRPVYGLYSKFVASRIELDATTHFYIFLLTPIPSPNYKRMI